MNQCVYAGVYTESSANFVETISKFGNVEAYCSNMQSKTTEPIEIEITRPEPFTQNMDLYPNPATNKVNVDLEGFEGNTVKIVVYDPLGKIVMEKEIKEVFEQTEHLDFSNPYITGGIYRVTAISDGTVLSKSIIIVK